MDKDSCCFCTKKGEVTVSVGDNITLSVESVDEIFGGEVVKIYSRAIQFKDSDDWWHESDIVEIYQN